MQEIINTYWIWYWGPDSSNIDSDSPIYGHQEFHDFDVMKDYSAKHSKARKELYPAYWSNYLTITVPKE